MGKWVICVRVSTCYLKYWYVKIDLCVEKIAIITVHTISHVHILPPTTGECISRVLKGAEFKNGIYFVPRPLLHCVLA